MMAVKKIYPKLHPIDRRLLVATGLLILFGLILLFSASSVAGYLKGGSSLYFLKRQMLSLLIGLVFFYFLSRSDYHRLEKWGLHFLILTLALVLVVFIPGLGASYNKAHNWINIFGFSIQPSEFAKLSFLIYLSAWLAAKKDKLNNSRESFRPFLIILIIISFFILKQPDLGTLLIIWGISLGVYFLAGTRSRDILVIVILCVAGVLVLVSMKSNKMERIECYLHPASDVQGKCYQLNQSLIAIGSGGFFGRGLGESRQKFMYIPEVWSDSIFAVVAEEVGFLFSLALIFLYFYIFYQALLISQRAPDFFGKLLAGGIGIWIFWQAFINIGGATNLIPMTGVPLPFVSSGGSAIMALLMALGILANISRQAKQMPGAKQSHV
jgi:cell division protein FtsW